MQAEYNFYIQDDAQRVIVTLAKSLKMNNHNYFACRTLFKIYKRKIMLFKREELMANYPDLIKFK
ncbi:MAG TPA: hypothetical protein DIT07_12925 [Sphingobacteriaceae bacterium]|nr:hypothetical protein [Sphingobacteriaceae bacterium]